jgi:hypothetical protein
MSVNRLRSGELIAGGSGALLLVSMFALKWYALSGTLSQTAADLGVRTSYTGWAGLSHLRYLLLLTIVAALTLTYFQAAQRAPAIPVTIAVIVTVLGGLTALALIYRVLINPHGSASGLGQQFGAYLGLLAAIGITFGGYASMRQESGSETIAGEEIETVRIGQPSGS